MIEIKVQIQTYGESEEETLKMQTQIRDAVVAVVSLCDLSIGTFVTSKIT